MFIKVEDKDYDVYVNTAFISMVFVNSDNVQVYMVDDPESPLVISGENADRFLNAFKEKEKIYEV